MNDKQPGRFSLRRKLIVNPPVQYVFIYYSLFIGAIFFTAGSAVTAITLKYLASSQFDAQIFSKNEFFIMGMLVILLVASILFGFDLSNRIAGPIFRVLRELQKIENVDQMQPITFRKNDYFQDLSKAYSDVLHQLKQSEKNNKKN